MAAESLGVPRDPSGALGEAFAVLGGPSEGPLESFVIRWGANMVKNQWFLIRLEKRVRAEPEVGLETRGPRRIPGRAKSGPEGGLRSALGKTLDVMC